jgi:hypothetical protein
VSLDFSKGQRQNRLNKGLMERLFAANSSRNKNRNLLTKILFLNDTKLINLKY